MKPLPYVLEAFLAVSLLAALTEAQSCQTQDSRPGQCKVLRSCPPILELFLLAQAGRATPEQMSRLRGYYNSRCSGNRGGSGFSFCCDEPESVTPRPTLPTIVFRTSTRPTPITFSAPSPTPRTPISGQPPNSVLPERCGTRGLVDRVISGEDAPLLAWPWMVLLEAVGPNGRRSVVCGGVLISDRYVLTAAHCVSGSSGFDVDFVRLGEHTISSNPDCQNGLCAPPFQRIAVGRIIVHENYGQTFGCRNCDDIALLRLATTADISSVYVQPICLPFNSGFTGRDLEGQNAWVAGWGTTDPVLTRPADVLQQVLLPIDRSVCGLDLNVFPNENMAMCAGGNQQDTCRGDSGGPMVMTGTDDVRYYVVGIVSQGPRFCAAPDTGGIYTNINFYVQWILRNMQA